MISRRFQFTRPHPSVSPRPQLDPHQRYLIYGPIQPLRPPSFLERLFSRR